MSDARTNAGRAWLNRRVYVIPAVIFLAVALPHLGYGDFRVDTGLYSSVGLQAWRTGELWTLRTGEQPYFNKPPLVFWIHGLVLHALGPSLLAARLPTVGAALGCVLAMVAIARELCGRRTALATGVVLALTIEFFRRVREISLDVWQLLFVLAALLLAVVAVKRERWGLLAAAGVPVGLALLCKPLVALLVIPIVAAWLVWIGRANRLGWVAVAAVLALAVAGPWHVSMAMTHGDAFVEQYLGREVVARAVGERITSREKPLWYYVRVVAETYWPWAVPFALGVVTWARGLALSRDARAVRLAVLWVLLWLLALSLFPDRRPRYAMPLWPATAWIAGMWLACWPWGWLRRSERAWLRATTGGVVGAGIVLAALPVPGDKEAAQGGVLKWTGKIFGPPPEPHWPALIAWMREAGVEEVWEGAVARSAQARLYLEFGRWPAATSARNGETGAEPPEGALLLYHRRGGRAPGENEAEVFRAGDVYVTRLGPGGWRPIDIDDPGE